MDNCSVKITKNRKYIIIRQFMLLKINQKIVRKFQINFKNLVYESEKKRTKEGYIKKID